MNQNAFWKFFRDFNFYNLLFSALNAVVFGVISGILVFLSFGMLIGYLGFNYFRKDEYFLYYNLGFSKSFLIRKVWICNLLFAGPLLLILWLFL